jgi:hypothetical protein
VRQLRRDDALEPEARKLLTFSDKQDASLQAGHFNDFVEVGLLRSHDRHKATTWLVAASVGLDVSGEMVLTASRRSRPSRPEEPSAVATCRELEQSLFVGMISIRSPAALALDNHDRAAAPSFDLVEPGLLRDAE